MSKNLTRKGLAFGALVALGTSVIAGAPANAAPTALTIASSYGTSLNTILGQGFDIALTASGITDNANTDGLKLYIEGATDNELLAADTRATTDLSTSTNSTAYSAAAESVFEVSDADKTAVIGGSSNKSSATGATLQAGEYNQFRIALNDAEVTATRTIKVTPFLDTVVRDGKPTPGTSEVTGNSLSITFVKASEITATTKLSTPIVGDTKLKATITLDKDINLEQINAPAYDTASTGVRSNTTWNSAVSVAFKTAGSTSATKIAAWKKTSAGLYAEATVSAIGSTTLYSAQAEINGLVSGSVSASSATAGSVELDDTAVAAAKVESTKGANIKANGATSSYGVRTGTKTVAVATGVIKKLNDDSTAALISVGAGVPATVKVTATTLATGSSYSAGGKTVSSTTSGSNSISFDTTTNADGKVVFDLTGTGAKDDAVSVEVKVLDKTSNYIEVGSDATYIWIDATTDHLVNLTAVGNLVQNVKGGSSYTLTYALADNFGALYSGTSERRVYVSASDTDAGELAAFNTYATFVNGKASITLTDGNSGSAANTAKYNVVATVKKLDSAGSATDDTDVSADVTTAIYTVKNNTPGFITITKGGNQDVTYKTFASADGRVDNNTWSTSDLGTAVQISGIAYDANGTLLPGTPVTITGAGILFRAKSGTTTGGFSAEDVYGLGSITVYTGTDGSYAVDSYSNKAGEIAITATAGTVSKSTTPDWNDAAPAKADTITITAPATVAPGTTAGIVIKVTDKYGNPVSVDNTGEYFNVSVTGAGSTSSFTQATDADGLLKINQVLGSNETGSFKVTVKLDADTLSTGTLASITKEATVTVAAPAAPVAAEPVSKIGTANGRVYVNVKDGKGAVVSVKIGTKWFTKTSLNNDYTFSFKAKKKSKVSVKVYVDGDLSSSKTITVK
jgi:hypothetical protein